jgi:uncharacterized membrane protein HdeD (DUF308 family)
MEAFFGALFLVGGILYLFGAFEDKDHPSYLWRFLIGVLYIMAGTYLLGHPLMGLQILTLTLIGLFYAQGILMVIFSFHVRKVSPKWGWAFINGLLTIGLATILAVSYPISSLWAIGLLVGINLLTFGFVLLMLGSIMGKQKMGKQK